MEKLPLPHPFKHRPRLGARLVVRNYTRIYLQALYREISDWIHEARIRSSYLLLYCIVYTEDFITQYLDHLFLGLYKGILDKEF